MANALTAPQQGEPAEIVGGDKTAWRRDDLAADYASADGWTLTYKFIWAGAVSDTLAMSADATGWKALADAADWTAGEADWFLQASHVTYGLTTVDRGRFTVLVNPASPGAGYDPRSHARKVLASIEAAIESRASQTDLKTTLEDGRSIERLTHAQLLEMRDAYAAKVRREDRAARGSGPGRVLVSM